MSNNDTAVHLLAGGLGGTVGAIVTCPLEVVKTRFQSSVATFHVGSVSSEGPGRLQLCVHNPLATPQIHLGASRHTHVIWRTIKHIRKTEGLKGLFKGLGPNIVGVAPTRAIYFCTYFKAKCFVNGILTPDTPCVHICSAAIAGFTSCSLTNPIWFVKTRLQLDQRNHGRWAAWHCIRDIYHLRGIRGFYKGITASYIGISETVIHFLIYEYIKAWLRDYQQQNFYNSEKTLKDFFFYMCAGAFSKICASIIAYPHEVARTRLRQEGDKYHSFFQTILLVYREEGAQGLYRGLATQLIRQIPNTAVMMATYEAVVYLMTTVPCNMPAVQIACDKEEEAAC